MIEKIYTDRLTQNSVSLRKQLVDTVDNKECEIGEPWRRAYINSIQGRAQVNAEVPEPYKNIIMQKWGETPTVIEPI